MVGIFDLFNPSWQSRYDEIKPCLKTGDVILVHGRYPGSQVVRALQLGNQWGHVCLVVRARDIDPDNQLQLPDPLIWESNTYMEGSVPNLWGSERKVKSGPMLVPLEDRLMDTQKKGEDVKLAIKPLQGAAQLKPGTLPAFFDSVIGKGFPTEIEIIHSAYLGRRFNKTSADPEKAVLLDIKENGQDIQFISFPEGLVPLTTSDESQVDKANIYCAELVAATFKHLGLLTQYHVSNAYSPKDFSDQGRLRLLQDAFLTKELFFSLI